MKKANITPSEVLEALGRVRDPELGKDLVSLGMIRDVSICGSKVRFTLVLTTSACPLRSELQEGARQAVLELKGVEEVEVEVTSRAPGGGLPERQPIPGVRYVIAVAACKGGVGKSTVSVNLALSLSEAGAEVGLLDADIYGPNLPKMLGTHQRLMMSPEGKISPMVRYGINLVSMGLLIGEYDPVIWRGPLVMRMMDQFLGDVEWGELDYLIVDLPPGTGDAQLTLLQKVPLTGAIIVTTPQEVALLDGRRGVTMFAKLNVPVLGIVENMSYFLCPHCGGRTDVFGRGGGERESLRFGVPFLGEIPLDLRICESGDRGVPIVKSDPDSPQAMKFKGIAQALVTRIGGVDDRGDIATKAQRHQDY